MHRGAKMPSTMTFPLFIAFGVSLAFVCIIYWIGGRVSPRRTGSGGGKGEPYACGEDLPAEESRVDLEKFLIYGLYFLIFDVLAFILATSYFATGPVPLTYISVILVAVAVLIFSRRHV